MNQKYSGDIDKDATDIDTSFLESKEVEDVEAEVQRIKLSDRTQKNLKLNGECNVTSPIAVVEFSTDKTTFEKPYSIDPYLEDEPVLSPFQDLSVLVSTCDVEWYELDDIISSNVLLRSPVNSAEMELQNPKDPHNYNSLVDVDAEDILCENIDNKLVKSLVSLVKNRVHGWANVHDVEVIKNRADVSFELSDGSKFNQKFDLEENTVEPTVIQMYSPYHEPEPAYSFWDLCRDTVGYVPSQSSEYDRMIGEPIPIVYQKGRWYVSDSVKEQVDILSKIKKIREK